ncbi:MAG: dinitrogenase iron-molybdenum cofactor biosynthesis protein [Magnetovibrionaceae bacterium]
MEQAPMSREMALRIGLAARELPDCSAAQMLKAVSGLVGLPPQEKKFGKIRLKDLKAAFEEHEAEISKEQFEAALNCLRGKNDAADVLLPDPDPYVEGDMPESIRVACASNEGEQMNGHFGSCARFLVYQVSAEEVRLIDIRSAQTSGEEEDKNAARADLIADCQVLFMMSIGGPAVAKVVRRDIHPVKIPTGGNAREKMEELKASLAGSTPPWLAKVMGHSAEDRIRFEIDEDVMEWTPSGKSEAAE